MKNRKTGKKWWTTIVVLIIVAVFAICGLSEKIIIHQYTIDSDKVNNPIRIVQISDIHSCFYGENMYEIVDAVNSQNPDIVVLTGDIFDDDLDNENSKIMISRLAQDYPLYYVSGNHEAWSDSEKLADQRQILEDYGVVMLDGEYADVTVNGETIRLYGVSDQAFLLQNPRDVDVPDFWISLQLSVFDDVIDESMFEILLAHRPDYIEQYAKVPFDLVLSGHTHGGVVRIPYLLNGLYAWGQGFFPQWSGGLYSVNDITTLIISRGLSRESSGRRFYNRPELVVIDIT